MKKLLAIVLICLIGLTGCDTGKAASQHSDIKIYPDISEYAVDVTDINNTYYYIVDNKTGVVYIGMFGYKRAGIAVALNADGTPMTKEQLEVEE